METTEHMVRLCVRNRFEMSAMISDLHSLEHTSNDFLLEILKISYVTFVYYYCQFFFYQMLSIRNRYELSAQTTEFDKTKCQSLPRSSILQWFGFPKSNISADKKPWNFWTYFLHIFRRTSNPINVNFLKIFSERRSANKRRFVTFIQTGNYTH